MGYEIRASHACHLSPKAVWSGRCFLFAGRRETRRVQEGRYILLPLLFVGSMTSSPNSKQPLSLSCVGRRTTYGVHGGDWYDLTANSSRKLEPTLQERPFSAHTELFLMMVTP